MNRPNTEASPSVLEMGKGVVMGHLKGGGHPLESSQGVRALWQGSAVARSYTHVR